jgi:hypothetical protein
LVAKFGSRRSRRSPAAPGHADVRDLQERVESTRRVRRLQHLDLALQLRHEHAPVGRNFIAVGRFKPVARISFWNELAFATLTSTPADRRVLPAASTARARSVCAPFGPCACPTRARTAPSSPAPGVDAVDEELDPGHADVVRRVGGDVDDAVHGRAVRPAP